jgi:hypothetical protein
MQKRKTLAHIPIARDRDVRRGTSAPPRCLRDRRTSPRCWHLMPTMTADSDTRLKTDIARVGRLNNGLPLYRFRYLWSQAFFVGVMAQEVLPVVPYAVIVGEDGFMRVNYAMLGTRLMTWDEWVTASKRYDSAFPKDVAEDWMRFFRNGSAPAPSDDPPAAELRMDGVELLGL